ncbi:hypothetical protein PF010_g28423 [Phytophthora fragariae]|uniref:Uncharacterized protein n=2 Tax=Phytophthora fragariae TaxID=53985 RepID=A0A6A3H9T0_9STRA|nr:hypothetical protein PF011_g27913 [Phytophthora fragariae]KAE9064923.1 hypothetical protein PF010_g28423 [Phytophthora fragariae]KAE9202207.1 hypothetical protein PF004_g18482 [Phytophthora fragariae]
MRRIGELYHLWLHEAPLLTKVVTAATLFGTGDRIAQRIEAKTPPTSRIFAEVSGDHEPHDSEDDSKWVSPSTARTLRMMVWGGLFAAPIMHTWFHLIEHAIPGTGKLVVAKKVAADMMIIAPGTSLAFFTVTKCMEGEPVRESFQTAKAKLPPTLLADYMLWPAANAIIFGLVPLHCRTPLTHCVSLVWSTFLSGMASHDAPKLTTPWSTGAPKPSVLYERMQYLTHRLTNFSRRVRAGSNDIETMLQKDST